MNKLLIIGCGGHSKVVTEIAELSGYEDIEYLETSNFFKESFLGRKVNKNIKNWSEDFFVAIGDNFKREKIFNDFLRNNNLSNPISLFHPRSYISKYSKIERGTLLCPFTVVNPYALVKCGVILNTNSIVEHDCFVDQFSSLAPGVKLGGKVKIGKRTAVSLGTTISHGINIGDDNLIGAQSFVRNDIGNNNIYYGIPAKLIRKREKGEIYL